MATTLKEREEKKNFSVELRRYFKDRPRVNFESVEDLDARTEEYFDFCNKHGKAPTIEGLAIAYKCRREYIYKLRVGERGKVPEVEEYLNEVKDTLNCDLIDQMSEVKGNPAHLIFQLKNNYGYKDVQEHVVTPDFNAETSAEELQARADMLFVEGKESPKKLVEKTAESSKENGESYNKSEQNL